jgi:glycine/D-amino acid oxidase-like deaminating enzyme
VVEHDIPCSWYTAGGVQPIFTAEVLAAARKRFESLQRHPDLRDKATLILDKDELAALRVAPEALAAVYQPNAARCWAYKLVAWLLEQMLADYNASTFNLQTHTAVEGLEREASGWVAHTARGSVRARNVVLASNAYTSHLLPRMTGLITPVRGQVCALVHPRGAEHIPHNYVWVQREGQGQYFTHQYLIQLASKDAAPPTNQEHSGESYPAAEDDGPLIFGCDYTAPGRGEGIWCDDEADPILGCILRRGLGKALKLLPGDQVEREELRAEMEWTGIMGYSADGGPWVGRVPAALMDNIGDDEGDVDGLWISAGYTGHGMPVAARCGVAVAEMVLGKEGGVQVPSRWIVSRERAVRVGGLEPSRTVSEMAAMMAME